MAYFVHERYGEPVATLYIYQSDANMWIAVRSKSIYSVNVLTTEGNFKSLRLGF